MDIDPEVFYEIRENVRVIRHDLVNAQQIISGLRDQTREQNGRVTRLEIALTKHIESPGHLPMLQDVADHEARLRTVEASKEQGHFPRQLLTWAGAAVVAAIVGALMAAILSTPA